MNNINEKPSSNRKSVIMNGVILALTLICLITAILTVREIRHYSAYVTNSEMSLLNTVTYGNYFDLIKMMYQNEIRDVKPTKTMEECYAVARYYEAAIDYHMCLQTGRDEEAAEKKKIMEEQIPLTGELSYVLEDIDKQFDTKEADANASD